MRCPVCMELYINPKILSCGHTLCILCVINIIKTNPYNNILCPTCRSKILDINNNVPLKEITYNMYIGLRINDHIINYNTVILEDTLTRLINSHPILSKNIDYVSNMKLGNSNYFYGS